MPFRERVRRAFGRSSSTSSTSADGGDSVKKTKSKADSYKPGEQMPRPKYRGPYNKAHQDKLKSFSFGDAWTRRMSDQSQYSPMGSRMPSRKNSLKSVIGRRSMAQPRRSNVGQVAENAGDDDVGNVGLSRQVTADKIPPLHEDGVETEDPSKVATHGGSSEPDGHKPFTEEDLALAVKKSNLAIPGMAAAGV